MKRPSMESVVLFVLATTVAAAQTVEATRHAQGAAAKPTSMSEAEVRKVDKDLGKITLKHGEIKNLDMPAMTMVFQVKEKSMLDAVKAGDRIRFVAEKVNGAFTVVQIEPSR